MRWPPPRAPLYEIAEAALQPKWPPRSGFPRPRSAKRLGSSAGGGSTSARAGGRIESIRGRIRAALKTQQAFRAAKIDPELADDAAVEVGELAVELRLVRWKLGVLLAVVLAGFGLLGAGMWQVLLRLPR